MPKIDPNRLYTALLNTGLQTKDNPLYQVLYNLIGTVVTLGNQITAIAPSGTTNINTTVNNTTIIQLMTMDTDDHDNELWFPPGR